MATTVSAIIDHAGMKVNDPNFRRTTRDEWLMHYNEVQNKIATETRILERDAYFDILVGESRYTYPDDSLGLKGLQYTLTPSDSATYYYLNELFRDEFQNHVSGRYPSGYVWGYFARPAWFQLVSEPSETVLQGGLCTYWHLPAWLSVETGAFLELPDILRVHQMQGMIIEQRLTGRERVAARDDKNEWLRHLSEIRDKIEDRSDDRRPAIRPPGHHNPMSGMT